LTRLAGSDTSLGWTPTTTTFRLVTIGWPAASRIGARSPAIRATASASPSVSFSFTTDGSQITRQPRSPVPSLSRTVVG
jgi:hypothetical protein